MPKAPIFVKIENYKEILKSIDLIKQKTQDAKAILAKLNDLKNEEDTEMQIWADSLEDVERKIDLIDSTLGEP